MATVFDPDDMRINLALQGGGVLGIAEVGAVAALREAGYRIENVAGTSAGSIVASMVAAGMSDADLRAAMSSLDYRRFNEIDPKKFTGVVSWLSRVPVVGRVATVLTRGGTYSGNYLVEVVDRYLKERDADTWGKLRQRVAEGRASNLKIISYTYNEQEQVTFPRAYQEEFGFSDEQAADQPISFAVRASSSIATFFVPPTLRDSSGRTWIFGDGGSAEDLPWLTAQGMNPDIRTVGVRLSKPQAYQSIKPQSISTGVRLFWKLLTTGPKAGEQALEEMPQIAANLITPDTLGIDSTNFGITPAQVQALYRSGYEAGREWVARDMAQRAAIRSALRRGWVQLPGGLRVGRTPGGPADGLSAA